MCSHREVKVDIQEILPIWQTCFGDEPEEIKGFFAALGELVRVYLYREQGRAVSMVHVIPARLITRGGEKPAAYLYGVGTLPQARGRGNSSLLVREVLEELTGQGIFPFLVPAEDGLVSFYERCGMTLQGQGSVWTGRRLEDGWHWNDQDGQFWLGESRPSARELAVYEVTVQEISMKEIKVQEITAQEYLQLRQQAAGAGRLLLTERAQQYALESWQQEGGQVGLISAGCLSAGVLYRLTDEGVLYLKELFCCRSGLSGEQLPLEGTWKAVTETGLSLAAALGNLLGAQEIYCVDGHSVMAVSDTLPDGEVSEYPLHFGLALD